MKKNIKSYKDLIIWQRSIDLVTKVYELVKEFPSEEKYGLVQQIKKSAVSIPSNIAEGAARNNKKEFNQFLGISLGSGAELHTQLIISKYLSFIKNEKEFIKIEKELGEIRAMTLSLKQKL